MSSRYQKLYESAQVELHRIINAILNEDPEYALYELIESPILRLAIPEVVQELMMEVLTIPNLAPLLAEYGLVEDFTNILYPLLDDEYFSEVAFNLPIVQELMDLEEEERIERERVEQINAAARQAQTQSIPDLNRFRLLLNQVMTKLPVAATAA